MSHESWKPSISVVVPVYNSEETLEQLVTRVAALLPALSIHFEILLVNDDSADGSWPVIERLAAEDHRVRGINLARNYGQHNALLCGIRAAQHEVVVTMDDDLQHPPEEIPRLLEKLAEGHDVVYGTPEEEQHGLWRDLASRATKLGLQGAMGVRAARDVSAFRAFRTSVREAFAAYRGPFASIDVLLAWGTNRFAAVPVRHDPRRVGRSNYTFRKLVIHAFNMLTGFSVLPLRLASWVGIVFALFGGVVLIYVLGRYVIEGRVVPGFAFLASIVAIFSGAQLLSLGIIGEYLARIHFRTMDKPAYVVRGGTPPAEKEGA
jgi:undecaprenyl-phosphate 4-deoxy-4-formamido-L-arabinose transferase